VSSIYAVFQRLWYSINADRAPWASNPWVWAVSFRVITPQPEACRDANAGWQQIQNVGVSHGEI